MSGVVSVAEPGSADARLERSEEPRPGQARVGPRCPGGSAGAGRAACRRAGPYRGRRLSADGRTHVYPSAGRGYPEAAAAGPATCGVALGRRGPAVSFTARPYHRWNAGRGRRARTDPAGPVADVAAAETYALLDRHPVEVRQVVFRFGEDAA